MTFLAPQRVAKIESAIYTLNGVMKCFRFKVLKNRTLPSYVDHLHIKREDKNMKLDCVSYVGRQGGKQVYNTINITHYNSFGGLLKLC